MVTVLVTPRAGENLFALLQEEERELRRNKLGTLHRKGPRKAGRERWVHKSYKGWIRFERGLGGTITAEIHSPEERDEWQLMTSFIGFLHRHFREDIGSVLLHYADE